MRYALLIQPSHNRVYAAQAPQLALAELDCLRRGMGVNMENLRTGRLGGADCLRWEQAEPLTETAVRLLARVSAALLLLQEEEGAYFPVEMVRLAPEDEDLVTIPKYSGRTNEQFTRLMINAALFSTPYFSLPAREVRILDPLCGRGTTLLEALVQGHDAAGIEIDKKEVEWFKNYLATYLKHKRAKHTVTQENITNHKGTLAQRVSFTFAPDKETMKVSPRSCQVVRGDTLLAGRYFPAGRFHVLAADLPYGVQHGAVNKGGDLSRRPKELLEAALPVWHGLLAQEGALALAYNTRTLAPPTLRALVEGAGYRVLEPERGSFAHRVDASIQRDLLLAVKA